MAVENSLGQGPKQLLPRFACFSILRLWKPMPVGGKDWADTDCVSFSLKDKDLNHGYQGDRKYRRWLFG